MAQKKQILDKIARNLEMLGMTVTRGSDSSVTAGGLTVKYNAADIASPMGGIDGSSSPFLGIGIGNPGSLQIDTGAALADAFDTADKARVLCVCASFANDIQVNNSDTDYRIRGNVDNIGLGQ